MPTIKTGEWLKNELSDNGITQKELAKAAGLSIPAIAKIISGERMGQPETWRKIQIALENLRGVTQTVSYSSDKFIDELKEEIELYGENQICNVFYTVNDGNIIFKDYLLPEDMPEHYGNDLKKMNSLRITLKEALDLFTEQDDMFLK